MVTVVIINTKSENIEANTIKNNLILQQPNCKKENKSLEPKTEKCNYKCCECYYKETLDSRCCGLCFYCGEYIYCEKETKCCYNCITSNLEDTWCLNNPIEYFHSGLFLTSGGYGHSPDCCCTLFAGIFLGKFALTFPCLLCSIFNGTINCVCGTDKNYLF
jgi:hypothetical protein